MLNENEQIEEIIKVLCADYDNCEGCPFAVRFVDYYTCEKTEQANRIVLEKGYRKVERGKWIFINQAVGYLEPPYGDTAKCSACEFIIDVSEMWYKFCPNCGADMRGETDERE